MNVFKILEKAGETALSIAFPGIAGPLIAGVNAILPTGEKLPDTATGSEIDLAVKSLPPDQQETIMLKQYDVEIAEINSFATIQQALASADATGNTTRPKIALMMAKIVCFSVIALISIWCVAMLNNATDTLKTLSNATMWIATVLGTPTTILFTYFGKRTKEKLNRYAMAAGQKQPGILSTLAGILKK